MSRIQLLALLLLLAAPCPVAAKERALAVPPSGVIGVDEAKLRPEYWTARLRQPDAVLMSPAQIQAQNARLLRDDPSMHALDGLPARLTRAQVEARIGKLSQRPTRELFGA